MYLLILLLILLIILLLLLIILLINFFSHVLYEESWDFVKLYIDQGNPSRTLIFQNGRLDHGGCNVVDEYGCAQMKILFVFNIQVTSGKD